MYVIVAGGGKVGSNSRAPQCTVTLIEQRQFTLRRFGRSSCGDATESGSSAPVSRAS
jgi:hypothetical protein